MSNSYPFYQVDAFASEAFKGNQACVMPLENGFLADATLQAIAAENNVAETAYLVADGPGQWQLRWFTPAIEVPLCGHATLAAAHILFTELGFDGDMVTFQTRRSGQLYVRRNNNGYTMDFPAATPVPAELSAEIEAALGAKPLRVWTGPYGAAEFASPDAVLGLEPDYRALATVDLGTDDPSYLPGTFGCFAVGGEGVDVTSRFFGPGAGIDEDPATGSWHCMLAVLGSAALGRPSLNCFQAYPGRGAAISTALRGTRVDLTGEAFTVIRGTFDGP